VIRCRGMSAAAHRLVSWASADHFAIDEHERLILSDGVDRRDATASDIAEAATLVIDVFGAGRRGRPGHPRRGRPGRGRCDR